MAITRWYPEEELSKQERLLLKRAGHTRKLFFFLRMHRHEIFDNAFQEKLESMYRGTGAGKPPVAPAIMAMAVLLQGYAGASDAETIDLTVVDLRWQMVLDRLGTTEPAFSQSVLWAFRQRMIQHDMDRVLLERTVEIARRSGDFDAKKLPKSLRVAIDSAPLEGAGRVEDTFNLLGHAARDIAACVAAILDWDVERVCREAAIPVLLESSVKKALDVEWSDPVQKAKALNVLVKQVKSLRDWVDRRLGNDAKAPPIVSLLDTLRQLMDQDLEPDPDGGVKVRDGVAPDRRISINDAEMRHGRKSKSKRFNGYKRHVATDLDSSLVLACAVTPANVPEMEAANPLRQDVERQGIPISQLQIDRGYINSPSVDELRGLGASILCKPWVPHNVNKGAFTKAAFHIKMRELKIICPAGQEECIEPGKVVEFDPEACDRCQLRERCTMASMGTGRKVSIAQDEEQQQQFRKLVATKAGRAKLRLRVGVEHSLSHVVRRQGRRARYCGTRKNLFDVRRAASLVNLETAQRMAA
jgi:hypothetical protein